MEGVSKTAIYVAAARAVGARELDPTVRNPDYLAEKLLGDPAEIDLDLAVVQALSQDYETAMQDIEVASTIRAMNIRTHFIDEALEDAVDSGASQILILGAGLDSHAFRFEYLLEEARVFEVDAPAMQAFKRERALSSLRHSPGNLSYVPVDFQRDDLREALIGEGYDFTLRSFVIMEGLTMYLTEDALRATLGIVAQHAPGSSIVFDFVTDVMVKMIQNADLTSGPLSEQPSLKRFLEIVRNEERWEFGFPIGSEQDYIETLGFVIGEMQIIGSEETAERYLTRADGTQVGAAAMARVPHSPGGDPEAMLYRIVKAIVPHRH